MPHLHPRFSLLTILLVMALVACGITIWQMWREVGPLRSDVRRLRRQVGELNVDDETKTHAIQVDTLDELTWKWRIWVPPGQNVLLRSRIGDVPKEGFPSPELGTRLSEGDNWFTFSVRRDPNDGTWRAVFDTGRSQPRMTIQPEHQWFQNTAVNPSYFRGVQKKQAVWLDDAEPFLLIRYRAVEAGKNAPKPDPDDLAPGFIIWLEQ